MRVTVSPDGRWATSARLWYQARLWGGRDVCCDTERSRYNCVQIGIEGGSGTQIAHCA